MPHFECPHVLAPGVEYFADARLLQIDVFEAGCDVEAEIAGGNAPYWSLRYGETSRIIELPPPVLVVFTDWTFGLVGENGEGVSNVH